MKTFAIALLNDEAGFIVSAELVLIASVCVLAMVVGLSEVANGINQELEDIGSAFGSINLLPESWAESLDISNAVLWLASDEARCVTGVALPVDLGASTK